MEDLGRVNRWKFKFLVFEDFVVVCFISGIIGNFKGVLIIYWNIVSDCLVFVKVIEVIFWDVVIFFYWLILVFENESVEGGIIVLGLCGI